MTLLDEGIARLRPFAPRCQGVDVATLVDEATAALERLRAAGSAGMRDLAVADVAPRIRFVR